MADTTFKLRKAENGTYHFVELDESGAPAQVGAEKPNLQAALTDAFDHGAPDDDAMEYEG